MSEERWLRLTLLPRRRRRRLWRLAPQVSPWRRVVAHQSLHPTLDLARRVGAPAVQLLVHGNEIGALRLEPLEEDLPDLAAQVQRDAADVDRAGLPRQLEDPLDLLGGVVDARHERGDQDSARDACAVELADGLEPRSRVRRVRLRGAPRLLVE